MRTALIQFTSSDDPEDNIRRVADMVDEAAVSGAGFVLTPEVTNCVSTSRSRQQEVLRPEADDRTLSTLQDRAAKHGIWLLIGSLALKTDDPDGRFANRCFAIRPDGSVAARYDKIHMFDVRVTAEETYRESAGYRPGDRAVTVETPFAMLGLTVCYDLRFPRLFRDLAQAGAEVITVPSAFSPATGPAHWEVLLRARAIETGAYILAPAQTGAHPSTAGRTRQSYGHSLAVDPWGVVSGDAGQAEGILYTEVNRNAVAEIRTRLPSLSSDARYDLTHEPSTGHQF